MQKGQSPETDYIMRKDRVSVWVTGETLLVNGDFGKEYMVKDLVNLQSKKHLQLFLTETEDLLERIFDSSTDMAMMILDGTMKIVNVNKSFLDLFGLQELPLIGSRLADLHHPFWNHTEMKRDIVEMLVNSNSIKNKQYTLEKSNGKTQTIRLDSKFIDRQTGIGKTISSG